MDKNESRASLKLAKKLKEVGFDWETSACYEEPGIIPCLKNDTAEDIEKRKTEYTDYIQAIIPKNWNKRGIWNNNFFVSAPTLEVVRKWILINRGYDIIVEFGGIATGYHEGLLWIAKIKKVIYESLVGVDKAETEVVMDKYKNGDVTISTPQFSSYESAFECAVMQILEKKVVV